MRLQKVIVNLCAKVPMSDLQRYPWNLILNQHMEDTERSFPDFKNV